MMDLRSIIYIDLLNLVDEETKKFFISDNAYIIQAITNPSPEMQLEAVRKNPNSIKYIKNPSELVQLEAVKINGYALVYIKNPSEEVQLEAVKQRGSTIQYIKTPSEQVQLEAIKNLNCIKDWNIFMQYSRKKINDSKALNLLYQKVSTEYKEQIKTHPNYKSDAQIIIDNLKPRIPNE